MIYITQHMIEEHGMNQHKLERMNWLVRVDPRKKGKEDQRETMEEMEKLVDHKYVKQQQEPTVVQLDVAVQQPEPKPEPPPDYTDYAGIIEEALLGEGIKGSKALSLEKIFAFVEGHPSVDVSRHPNWKDSVRKTLCKNHRFKLVPVRKAVIVHPEEGIQTLYVKDTFWRLRCDGEKADQPPASKDPIFPPGHRGRAGGFKCKECGLECEHALDLIDHMRAENHMADASVRCPSCANQVRQ